MFFADIVFAVVKLVFLLNIANALMNELSIDMNDIMSDKLMPVSLFLIEGRGHDNGSDFNDITELIAPKSVGNFQKAYATMGFHRYLFSVFHFGFG